LADSITTTRLFSTFVFPIALAAIGWELYMINAVWDALEVLFIGFFWVETKGLTLEQIDLLMGGSRDMDSEMAAYGNKHKVIEGLTYMPMDSSPDIAAVVKMEDARKGV
jgi:hypothetical protein